MVDWKTIAITLMIVVVIESAYLIYIYWTGYDYVISESKCYATCTDEGYVAYNYDFYTKYCYCFDKDSKSTLVDIS